MEMKILILMFLMGFAGFGYCTEGDTLLVLEIARHGTRVSFSKIYVPEWTKQIKPTYLTQIGLRQHYLLGKTMAKQFP